MKEISYIQRNPMAPKDAWDSLSIADKAAMMRVAVQNGITNLDDIRQKYNEFAEGGNIYAGGSYMPSEGIKKRISKWEGKAMTGAKDPLSGKFLKNNSFESEAVAFTQALPESIRDQVLSNPELADNLFSYSYNVGAPRFKQRVVKALEDYYAGKGTAKKIADSMWASGDAKLRGLRNRRAEEKKGVMNALRVDVPAMQVPELPVNTTVFNPFILPAENTTFFPQVTPVEDNYVEVQEITPEQRRAEQVRNTFNAINNYNMMMDMLSIPNNPQPMYVPKNAPYVVKGLGGPIVEAAMNEYKKGGGIHIKHPGRLTALKKRTGKTEAELYNDGNPAHKKMVVFARSARKWKHGDGGNLYGGGGIFGLLPINVSSIVSKLPSSKQEIRKRLYENIIPYDYDNATTRVAKAVMGNTKEGTSDSYYMPEVDDLWATYLQIPKSERHTGNKLVNEGHHLKVLPGIYKPTKGIDSGKYYRLNLNEDSKKAIVDEAMGNTYEEGFDVSLNPYNNHLGLKEIKKDPINIGQNRVATSYDRTLNWALRDFTVGKGRDNKGEYVSYYDLWDLSPYRISSKDQSLGIGKPFELYDRIYLDDYYEVPKEDRGHSYLPEVTVTGRKKKKKKALGGNLFSGEEEGSQQMITTHKPYYDRDGILLYNRTLPETVIIPDSQLSPAERNYRERQRQRNLPDYAQHKDREITLRQVANTQKEWENSFEKQALDYGQAIASGLGMGADMVSRLPIYSSLKGASTLSRAETPLDYAESGLWLAPIVSTVGKAAYDAAKPVVSKAANEAAIAWTLRNPEVPEGYIATKPQVRTRVGDVEIDNPNLLYHLDRGDGAGAFSTQGAYIEDGFLLPGTPKDAASVPYSWWNKGKPYATSVNGQPMTRLMTVTEDTPGMLNVRSQKYPIGQWNGKRGFVLPSEYVSSKPVDVSNNTYNWIEGYGWKKNIPDFSVSMEEGIAEAQANPTEKLLKWLHKPLSRKVKEPVTSVDLERLENLRDANGIKKYPGLVKMMKEWEDEGIDLSKIGKEDLDKIYQQRWSALIRDAGRPRRYTLIEPEGNGYNMTDYLGLRPVGDAVLNVHDTGNLYIGNIHNKTRFDANPVKGVFERGLNAAINTAHSEGREGIITGEQFLSAPKQIPVVERNPYRIKLEGRGYHQNAKMVDDYRAVHKPKVNTFEDNERYVYNIDDMLKAGNQQYTVFPNAPAWFLPKPSRHVPTKSRTFSTHSIDRFGNMIIDWNNPFVFKNGGIITR